MRYFCLVLCFALNSFQSEAQRTIDSLQNVLKENLADSTRMRVLVLLSEQYKYEDVNKSRSLSEEAISLAENLNLPGLKSKAYKSMGAVYRVSGDYSSALRLDNMALESSLLANDSAMIARAYNNVAHDYHDLGEYDESYYYFTQDTNLPRQPKILSSGSHHSHVGRVFKELGQYDRHSIIFNLSK